MSETVVSVRLVNGDEILGRLKPASSIFGAAPSKTDDEVDLTKKTFTLQKVRHLLVQQTRDGLGVTLMPWSFSNVDGDVIVQTSAVLAVLNPSAETLTSYLEQTTGIKLLS